MTDPTPDRTPPAAEVEAVPVPESASPRTCAQCSAAIPEGGGVATENAVFCATCYGELTRILEEHLAEQGRGISYPGAVAGGLLGGLIGAGVWWGFTVLTKIQFGLVAVLIGFAAGKGVVALSGGKRARPLQVIAVAVTLLCYGLATYWVNRTFIMEAVGDQLVASLPVWPAPDLFFLVVKAGFQAWDLIFVGIALWQAWKTPAPIILEQKG